VTFRILRPRAATKRDYPNAQLAHLRRLLAPPVMHPAIEAARKRRKDAIARVMGRP